jgi:serine/threonine-protein kinase
MIRESMANRAEASQSLFVFEPGAVLGRRYRVDATIASGGMGTVFRGTHLALGHEVAIKVLHERALNDDALRRFAREARLAAHLGESSRHIARVVDFGVERGRPFLVMELLRGEDLRERLERDRILSPEIVVRFVSQLCEALDVAHEEGVVHRDVKPANVFLARTGSSRAPVISVKLMDFGVATLASELTPRNGLVLGTPAFMAPEQIEGREVDLRADLWAVAALVYRMLTGRYPFGSGAVADVGSAIVDADFDPPTEHAPDLPPAIDAWMERALAKDPDARFSSAGELSSALADALDEPQYPSYPALERHGSGVRRVRRRPHMAVVATIMATIAGLVVVLLSLFRR